MQWNLSREPFHFATAQIIHSSKVHMEAQVTATLSCHYFENKNILKNQSVFRLQTDVTLKTMRCHEK